MVQVLRPGAPDRRAADALTGARPFPQRVQASSMVKPTFRVT